jgi:hypothetical protein
MTDLLNLLWGALSIRRLKYRCTQIFVFESA